MITDEVEGLLIPVDDANALAEAINRIISNPALSSNMGKMAKLRSGEWAIEKIAGKWIS